MLVLATIQPSLHALQQGQILFLIFFLPFRFLLLDRFHVLGYKLCRL